MKRVYLVEDFGKPVLANNAFNCFWVFFLPERVDRQLLKTLVENFFPE